MRKILKAALAALIAGIMAIAFSICAFAEVEDVEMPVAKATMTNGGWGQSVTYDVNAFDCSRITQDTVVYVEYELDREWTYDRAPVELILFNYTDELPRIWAKIEPYEWDQTSASFDYDTMNQMYEYNDFATVDNLCIGDTGVPLKVTKLTITNCTVVEEEETTVSETEEEVTETEPAETETTTTAAPETEAATEAATTAAAAAQTESSGGGIPLIPIVIAAVVVAAVVVTLVVIKKNKNKFY